MTTEEPLSTAERIRRRRELRDQQLAGQNGPAATVVEERQPRTIETVVEEVPQEEIIKQEPVVVNLATATPADAPPPATSRRTTPVPRPDETTAPVRRRIITSESTPPPAKVEEVVQAVKAQEPELPPPPAESRMERAVQQAANASQALILGLLEHMRAGEQLLITRDGQNVWSIVLPTSVVGNYQVKVEPTGKPAVQRTVAQGRLPIGFWDNLQNPAYNTFQTKWRSMTDEQKLAHAKALKVTLPTATDPKVFNMNLMMAVQAAEGIDKWKPEYSTTAAREAAKDKALKGMPY